MSRAERIRQLLQRELLPTQLELLDQSAHHEGHAGARAEGETHYHLRISAPQLAGLSRLAQQRRINTLLQAEFESGLHALTISLNS